MAGRGALNAFQLKVIMVVLMTLDHLYYNLFPEALAWAHIASRVVAPTFCFLVAEGLVHTRNRLSYLLRMLGVGVIMLGASAALHMGFGTYTGMSDELSHSTILLSLGLSAAVICAVDLAAAGKKRFLWLILAAGLLYLSTYVEGGMMLPAATLIFYYLRQRPVAMSVLYVVVFGWMYLQFYFAFGTLSAQFYMILAVIPILLYNGERGPAGAFAKYFFYLYYPLHIWLIYIVEQTVL